jgi:magnesium chelatase family protein
VRKYCKLTPALRLFLEDAAQRTGLSSRACQRILKVSRTIADLDGSEAIGAAHLAEALAYRGLDGAGRDTAVLTNHWSNF